MKTAIFDNQIIIHAETASVAVKSFWFEPDWLQQQQWVLGTSSDSGRNPAYFFRAENQEFVLRHYWRGGLPAKFIQDRYLFLGLKSTRPYKELALMDRMWRLQLPIAQPIAARVCRFGWQYTGDIISAKLPQSRDLVAVLADNSMDKDAWGQLGQVLASFHKAGIYHADLNARNILLSKEQFFLIDFDRGEHRKPSSDWQQANLQRLRRSFIKEFSRVEGMHYDDDLDWTALTQGYQAGLLG